MSSDSKTQIKGDIKTGGDDALFGRRALGLGASFSGHEWNRMWLNVEPKEEVACSRDFLDIHGISGADTSGDSRSAAVFDYDRDGYQDFVLVNTNRPAVQLYRNRIGDLLGDEERVMPIFVELIGGNHTPEPSEWTARDGYHAKVWVEHGGDRYLRELRCGEGLGAQNSHLMMLGIGHDDKADRLVVQWPSGREQVVEDVPAGTLVSVYENPAQSPNGQPFVFGSRTPVELHYGHGAEGGDKKVLGRSQLLVDLAAGKTDAPYRLYMTWFIGCAQCKKNYPNVNAVRAAFAENDLAIFGFNNASGDSPSEMAKYLEKTGVDFINLDQRSKADIREYKKLQDEVIPPLYQKKTRSKELASRLTPTTILADADGNVLHYWYEFPTVSDVKKVLHDLEGGH